MWLWRDPEKGRHCPWEVSPKQEREVARRISYRRFRRRILRRRGEGAPVASTPLSTRRRCFPCAECDPVRQRLVLDSPTRDSEAATSSCAASGLGPLTPGGNNIPAITPHLLTARGRNEEKSAPQQDWTWTTTGPGNGNNNEGSEHDGTGDPRPFALLDRMSGDPQSEEVMKLAAPALLNDYYTNLLDCSCHGVLALALGSAVYLWNSETQTLEGSLQPGPHIRAPAERSYLQRQAVSSVRWSRDGRLLSVGTRQGHIKLWDVEQKSKVMSLQPHLSTVGAISWKQHLLSSGSVLGRIHHHDPRAPTPLVGVALQPDSVCALDWSPGEERLASGCKNGSLCIWDGDIGGVSRERRPIVTMRQPSAVKAMAWCPWQRHVVTTGGGWKDGALRIWDVQSASCIDSVQTHSQICSLLWAEERRLLVTGHGPPRHHITCWTWASPSLRKSLQLAGHLDRVLHVSSSSGGGRMFSAGADGSICVWDV